MKLLKLYPVLLVALVLSTTTLIAQPGSIDTSFGNNGVVIGAFGAGDDMGYAVAVQDDGKILVAGATYNGTNLDFLVVRYNYNGTPDETFADGGVAIIPFAELEDYATAIKVQADGKIVVAGKSQTSTSATYGSFAVLRLLPNGSLDNSFGGDGKVTTQISSNYNELQSIALQDDGKILATGIVGPLTAYDFGVVRYMPDGSLDESFGGDGIVETDVNEYLDYAGAIQVLGDGRIVVSGSANNGTGVDFVMVRYLEDGTLDNSFGGDGKVSKDVNDANGADNAWGMNVQSDGKYLVSGYGWNGTNSDFAIVRFNEDGSLDESYGGDGAVLIGVISGTEQCWDAAIQPDDKLLLAGHGTTTAEHDFILIRVKTDGTLDESFAVNGAAITPIGAGDDRGSGVAIHSDGRMLVTGRTLNGENFDMALVRYNGDNLIAVSESRASINMEVFPNPVTSALSLNVTGRLFEVKISNSEGKLIRTLHDGKKNIDVGDLSNGVYYIEAMGDFGRAAGKFILSN